MSLFHNDSCCGNAEGETKHKHTSCICGLLDSLTNGANGNFCAMTQPTVIRVIPKGAEEPLDVNGSEYGTDFTLVRFDRKSHCVVLSYYVGVAPAGYTQTVVLDCRCICGIICINSAMTTGL